MADACLLPFLKAPFLGTRMHLLLHAQLIFRTINTARSAFFAITFNASFFDEFWIHGGAQVVQSAVLLKVRLSSLLLQPPSLSSHTPPGPKRSSCQP
jgi:hypothetical protein